MVVVLVDKANGNDTVGNMWVETHIYDETITIREILIDLGYEYYLKNNENIEETIRIQIGKMFQ